MSFLFLVVGVGIWKVKSAEELTLVSQFGALGRHEVSCSWAQTAIAEADGVDVVAEILCLLRFPDFHA